MRLPVRCAGGRGAIQPSSNARSMIAFSIPLMVTGSLLMPSTHAPSHGAGHSRPVNSGKLLVATQPFDSRLPPVVVDQVVPVRESGCRAGSPGDRTGCRSPCSARPAGAACPRRTAGRPPASRARDRRPGRVGCFLRAISMNPVGLPMGDAHQLAELGHAARLPGRGLGLQHALVVARHHLHPVLRGPAPT